MRANARRPITEKGRKLPAPLVGPFAPIKPPGAPRRDGQNRPSIWVRLRVRWKRRNLDATLADGANPATSAELALRAETVEPAMRARMAAGIENLFRLATEGPGPRATTAMVVSTFDRRRVAANQPGLAALAARLRAEGGPHTIRGLPMASKPSGCWGSTLDEKRLSALHGKQRSSAAYWEA